MEYNPNTPENGNASTPGVPGADSGPNSQMAPPAPEPPPYPTGGVPLGYGAPPPPLWNSGPPAYGAASSAPAGRKRRRASGMQTALLAVGLALILLVGLTLGTLLVLSGQLGSLTRVPGRNNTPPANTFAVLQVVGNLEKASGDALGINDPSYHHVDTVEYIKALAEEDGNLGILLYMNTPGGGVLESDEVYVALQAYRETTGRPVWAYMADICASGGYYVSMAAEHVAANRNTLTGSIGVYIAFTDVSGLYEKLGIETVLVRSGENKGAGTPGTPITPEQRDVYQSIVDEHYAQFVEIVAQGRGMPQAEVRQLSDGRVYSANQAKASGLIDEITDWDATLAAFEEKTGGEAFYPNFSKSTALGQLIGSFTANLPRSDLETQLALAEQYPFGVPMALYQPQQAA